MILACAAEHSACIRFSTSHPAHRPCQYPPHPKHCARSLACRMCEWRMIPCTFASRLLLSFSPHRVLVASMCGEFIVLLNCDHLLTLLCKPFARFSSCKSFAQPRAMLVLQSGIAIPTSRSHPATEPSTAGLRRCRPRCRTLANRIPCRQPQSRVLDATRLQRRMVLDRPPPGVSCRRRYGESARFSPALLCVYSPLVHPLSHLALRPVHSRTRYPLLFSGWHCSSSQFRNGTL